MDLQKFWIDFTNNSFVLVLLTVIAFALVLNLGKKKSPGKK